MALFTVHSPNYASRCWEHDDCRADDALACACWASTHTHVWSVRGQWFDYKNEDGTPQIVQQDVYVSHVGRVVAKGVDYNKQVMSDVWDNVGFCIVAENGTFRKIETYYGPGAGPGWDVGPHADVDAPADLIAAYHAHVATEAAERKAAAEAYERKARAAREETERKAPRKGRRLRVVRGRKIPIGTEGTCFWMGESRYGTRVGLRVEGSAEPVWVDAKNVEAVT